MTEHDLQKLLMKRYSGEEWVYLSAVRNGTGFARKTTRTADALVMSVWPSRGLGLHGFEIKVNRGDWLKEKNEPAKAEEIARFCDTWWLVVSDAEIVQAGELPHAWGLLVARGSKLAVSKEAEKLTPQPMDRLMLASILRSVSEGMMPRASIADEVAAAQAKGLKIGKDDQDFKVAELKRDLEALRGRVALFEKESGIKLDGYDLGKIGAAAKAIADARRLHHQLGGCNGGIEGALNLTKGLLRDLEKAAEEYGKIGIP